jgi:hypothetical protein
MTRVCGKKTKLKISLDFSRILVIILENIGGEKPWNKPK